MKPRHILAVAVMFAVAAAVFAQGSGEAKAKSAPKSAASRLVVMPASDLKWTDLDPTGAPGVKIADLWGTTQEARSARSSSCRRVSRLLSTLTPATSRL
jgi:hypothetical protein